MEPNQPIGVGALPTLARRATPPPDEIGGHGRRRVMIEGVVPEINAGRFPIKRVPGERVVVEADVFAEGHDLLGVVLKFRHAGEADWLETPMEALGNDRWWGAFKITELGNYFYTIEGWVDAYKSWRSDLLKRINVGQDVSVDLVIGAQLVEASAGRAHDEADAAKLRKWAREFSAGENLDLETRTQRALDADLAALTLRYPDRSNATLYPRELQVTVDPVLARTGAWYEMFPRSCPGKVGRHGTFRDVEAHLSRIAERGFDILYLPPIHPIGRAFRKGRNNNPVSQPDDPGSPWGIGSAEGGHTAIHPELGTLEDFHRLVEKAREQKIEIALDIAFQCSPDHPWVREHPAWFKRRPDGTIQYAENPPKKYQDIYPIYFETDDWQNLWRALKGVVDYWVAQGVRVFRVDNPHTKALPFWEWAITEIRRAKPDVFFLAEAFTRPRVMYGLAKLGFNQSYNYFPWRTTRHELIEFITEVTQPPVSDFFRPNLWPNTPDILPYFLQHAGPAAFMIRFLLAATLGASYGIYGPSFELLENDPREPGSEEYLNSEKYEIRDWNLDQPNNLSGLIARVNRIRRDNPALHRTDNLQFHATDNETLIAYSKVTDDLENLILVVVNLDPNNVQSGWVDLDLDVFEIGPLVTFEVQDLLSDARYFWHGPRNYLELRPSPVPAHLFRIVRPSAAR